MNIIQNKNRKHFNSYLLYRQWRIKDKLDFRSSNTSSSRVNLLDKTAWTADIHRWKEKHYSVWLVLWEQVCGSSVGRTSKLKVPCLSKYYWLLISTKLIDGLGIPSDQVPSRDWCVLNPGPRSRSFESDELLTRFLIETIY